MRPLLFFQTEKEGICGHWRNDSFNLISFAIIMLKLRIFNGLLSNINFRVREGELTACFRVTFSTGLCLQPGLSCQRGVAGVSAAPKAVLWLLRLSDEESLQARL